MTKEQPIEQLIEEEMIAHDEALKGLGNRQEETQYDY